MMGCATLVFAFLHVTPVFGSPSSNMVVTSSIMKTQSAWPELSKWLTDQGGWFQSSIKSTLTSHGGAMIRGLVLDSGSFMGTTLLEIPRALWLELRFWPHLEQKSLAHHSTCSDLSDSEVHRLKFASGLAIESRKGNASEHNVYLRHLPTLSEYQSFHPSFMNPRLQQDFCSMPVVEFAQKAQADEARMKACFLDWKSEPQSSVKDVNWDEISSGLSHLRNRGFIVEKNPLMIPIVDLINTEQSDAVNADVNFNMDVVSLVVSSTWVESGQELLYGYCTTCDNNIMLSQWGVFLEGNTNPLPADHSVDCHGKQGAANTSSGHTKSLQEVASSALDLKNYLEGSVPRCKADTFASEQGALRCSLARLAWDYCGRTWMQKPGALHVENGTSASESSEGVFLKAKQHKNIKVVDWASMVNSKFMPLNSTSMSPPRRIAHNRSALRQHVGRLQQTL